MGLEKRQDQERLHKNSGKTGVRNIICNFINPKIKTEFEKVLIGFQINKKMKLCSMFGKS